MKSLPKRSYYDFKGAASVLNISVDDLNFHLRESNIRYAFTHHAFASQIVIPLQELPELVQQEIATVLNRPDAIDILNIAAPQDIFNRFEGAKHNFLYLQHNDLSRCLALWSEPEAYRGFVMRLEDDSPVALFNEGGRLHGAWLGDINHEGVLSEAVIAANEIAEYIPGHAVNQLANRSENRDPYSDGSLPFSMGERAGDVRRAISEMGNEYFKTYGMIPTPRQLRDFMVTQSPTPWIAVDQPNGRTGFLTIENQTLSYDAFKSRYKRAVSTHE